MAVLMKIKIFWDVMPCCLENSCKHFEGACCLYIQSLTVQEVLLHSSWAAGP